MTTTSTNKFNNVAVFSGGGTRFAIYCGMYAALTNFDCQPNLIIASCGGALATTIINSFATNNERLAYLKSNELYQFMLAIKLTKQRKLKRIGYTCLKQLINKKNAPYIENAFDRYLVDVPQDIAPYLPSLSKQFDVHTKSIIVGSKILFDKSDVGKRRNNRKLYRRVLFTDNNLKQQIDKANCYPKSPNYYQGAIEQETEIIDYLPITTASRISIADMFYLQPVMANNTYFAGGAIDLTPIELAMSMGNHIFFEQKDPYTTLEEALVRGVLGYSGNDRLHYVHQQAVYKWIDTRNIRSNVEGNYCKKSINLLKMQVNMSMPQSYEAYADSMQALWNYGYKSVEKALNL